MGKIAGAFGKINPAAAGGKSVDSTNATSANTGLTAGQLFMRKALSRGLAGAGKGLQDYQQQQFGGSAPPINVPQAPQFDFSQINKPKNPFFGY